MKTLQEILNGFSNSEVGKMKEGKLRQKIVGMDHIKTIIKDDVFEEKRRKGVYSSNKIRENSKKQITLVNQYYRENQVCCPNCGSKGKKPLMEKYHLINCKRPHGFSDDKIYKLHLDGYKSVTISRLSNVRTNQICKILKKYKKDFLVSK
jgi:hypothetical protein